MTIVVFIVHNLSVLYSCNIPKIRNVIGSVESVYLFFNTLKRQKLFTEQLELFKEDENKKEDGCHSKKEKETSLSNPLSRTP